jgi:prolyl 4-hydroxylase
MDDLAAPAATAVEYCPIDTSFPKLRVVCLAPPIYVVEDFLSAEQCAEIILVGAGGGGLEGSGAHNAAAHVGVEPPRTSTSMELGPKWCGRLHAMAERLTLQPAEHMEMPTLAKYEDRERYVAHHDAFPPGDPLAAAHFGGNRICTVLMYLNDVVRGGKTTFHLADDLAGGGEKGLSVTPKAGRAVVFFPSDYASGRCDPLALHEAERAADEKWVSQLWVRQGPPGAMRTQAGRAAESAALALVEAEAEAQGSAADTAGRPPEPAQTLGQGSWRWLPEDPPSAGS